MDNGSCQYRVVDELASLLEAWPWGGGWSIRKKFLSLGVVHNCQHSLICTEGTN